METKQYITLEVKKNDFAFAFQMPTGATWGSAIDAAYDVLQKLNELSQQSAQSLRPSVQEPVAEKQEEVLLEGE